MDIARRAWRLVAALALLTSALAGAVCTPSQAASTGGAVTGTVTDAAGAGIQGMQVEIVPDQGGEDIAPYAVNTDAAGYYEIPAGYRKLYGQPYTFFMTDPQGRFLAETRPSALVPQDGATVVYDAQATAGATISGVLSTPTGKTPPYVSLTAWRVDGSTFPLNLYPDGMAPGAPSTTPADGAFTIGTLPPGTYKVQAYDGWGDFPEVRDWYNTRSASRSDGQSIVLAPGDHVDLAFDVFKLSTMTALKVTPVTGTRTAKLRATVTSTHRWVPTGQVKLVWKVDGVARSRLVTLTDGVATARLTGLDRGKQRFKATYRGSADHLTSTVKVTARIG